MNSKKIDVMVVSLCCSDELYDYVLNSRLQKHVDPAQKFFRNLIYGLKENEEIETVNCISAVPVSKRTHNKRKWDSIISMQDGIVFNSPSFYNGGISTFTSQIASTKCILEEWINTTTQNRKLIILDTMVGYLTDTVCNLAHHYSVPVIGVVTDLPLQWAKMGKVHGNLLRKTKYFLYSYYSESRLKKLDGYAWLTQEMNTLKNKKNKPFCIIEGVADFSYDEKKVDILLPKKFALYAGGIHKVFRIDRLCEAFIKANVDATLLLFGDGDAVNDLKIKYQGSEKIKFMGVVSSQEIRYIEKKAWLLINPRPTSDEYTKYSFPSKTLEYLCSGTPVLSTKLKGIPSDYTDYLFWFEEENVESMASKIKAISLYSDSELISFGQKSKDFAYQKKNAKIQAHRLIELFESYFGDYRFPL